MRLKWLFQAHQLQSKRSGLELVLPLTSNLICRFISRTMTIYFRLHIVFFSRKHYQSMARGCSWCFIKLKVITIQTPVSMLVYSITSAVRMISSKSSTLFSEIKGSNARKRLDSLKTVLTVRRTSAIISFWAAWLQWMPRQSNRSDLHSSISAQKTLPSSA